MRLELVTIVALASCGRVGFDASSDEPIGDLPDGVSPGSRLRVRWLIDETNAASFDTFFDTRLDTACRFTPAADGVTRCLPDAAYTSATNFADPSCTRPVAFSTGLRGDCDPARFATDPTRVFAVGAPLSMGYSLQGPNCVAVTAPFLWFELGEEIPPETFVAARTIQVPASSRFSYEQLEAEDGARQLTGRLIDHAMGGPCRLEGRYFGQADPRCAPVTFLRTAYLDSACTQPVFLMEAPITAGTLFATYGDAINGLSCRLPTYHRAREPQPVATVYVFDTSRTTGCIVHSEPPAAPTWVVPADDVARDELGVGQFDTSAGRVTRPVWYSADGFAVRGHPELFDRTLGSLCTVQWSTDGTRRCMPLPLGVGWATLDPGCATAPVSVYGSCGESAAYGQTVAPPTAQTCGNIRLALLQSGPTVPLFGRPPPGHACTALGRVGSTSTGAELAPTAMSAMRSSDVAPGR